MRTDTFNKNNASLPHYKALWGNDENTLKDLYLAEFFKTAHYVLTNNGTEEQAKDIYQDAFIALWRNVQLGRFVPQNETALAGYLYQVAKNKWIDYLRSGHFKKTVQISNLEKEYEPVEELPAEQSDYINKIKKGLLLLGKNCKEVLDRFYYKNESMKTIAAAMNWTEATARNNKYRCLEKLREQVKNKNH